MPHLANLENLNLNISADSADVINDLGLGLTSIPNPQKIKRFVMSGFSGVSSD